ncbi:hypothetical protein A4X13_0g3077, partial [Tilletia indica]
HIEGKHDDKLDRVQGYHQNDKHRVFEAQLHDDNDDDEQASEQHNHFHG